MSRQLARIRGLINEIDTIQKQGQHQGRHAFSMAVVPEEHVVPEEEVPEQVASAPSAETTPVEPLKEVGRIAIQLTGNVIVQMRIDEANETVEVRHILNSNQDLIEIRFSDGKAVHLPLKPAVIPN